MAPEDGSIQIAGCPEGYVRSGISGSYAPSSSRIPLLSGLDR